MCLVLGSQKNNLNYLYNICNVSWSQQILNLYSLIYPKYSFPIFPLAGSY